MQKWESYRNEINQSSKIGYVITQDALKIEKYKKEIDKINPTILQNLGSTDLDLHKGVSEVIVSQNQVPVEITRMFKDLNKAKASSNKNTVSTILFNLKNDNILDDQKKLKETWLNNNSDYAQLANYISAANLNLDKNKDFEKELHTKYENLSVKQAEAKVGDIKSLSQNLQKNVGHHVFVISIAIATVFFVITLILLVVRFCII
ncbi:MAG: hypothetical protein ACOQNY_02405 [Mycoplasmoidaceae bacterium]